MEKATRMAVGDLDAVEAVIEDGATVRQADRLDQGDGMISGVWEAGPFTWTTEAYPVDETCVVIEGTIVLRYPDGSEDRFGPGDAFALRRGIALTWHQDDRVRKFFVTREP